MEHECVGFSHIFEICAKSKKIVFVAFSVFPALLQGHANAELHLSFVVDFYAHHNSGPDIDLTLNPKCPGKWPSFDYYSAPGLFPLPFNAIHTMLQFQLIVSVIGSRCPSSSRLLSFLFLFISLSAVENRFICI